MTFFRFLKMNFSYAMLAAAAGTALGQVQNPLVPICLFIVGVIAFYLTRNELTEVVRLADNKIKVEP